MMVNGDSGLKLNSLKPGPEPRMVRILDLAVLQESGGQTGNT